METASVRPIVRLSVIQYLYSVFRTLYCGHCTPHYYSVLYTVDTVLHTTTPYSVLITTESRVIVHGMYVSMYYVFMYLCRYVCMSIYMRSDI